MSKDIKPKKRIGQTKFSRKKKIIIWSILVALAGIGGWVAYRSRGTTKVEVPVARVRRGEFVDSVRTRGEVKSANSVILSAPQVPDLQIVSLVPSGYRVKKGDVVVEFDAAQQEQNLLQYATTVRTVDSEIVQTRASHTIVDEQDAMNLMTAEYNLERARLEASKAEVISEIEGAKNRIDVTVTEGELGQVKTALGAHDTSQEADLERLQQRKDKTVRDLDRAKGYLSRMVVRSPIDGIVNILPNFRSAGSWGSKPPPFKEGDTAWTGAGIAEIPDLSLMRLELNLEEVDRGRLRLRQSVRIKVDAIPDREFTGDLDWISPIAFLQFRMTGTSEKSFPARATLKEQDDRLRPGMSGTAEVIIERLPDVLLIPARASFLHNGKPAVYVQRGQNFQIRNIEVGKRNDTDLVVLSGLNEGETVAMEDPAEAAKRAKKL
jgi:multidrug efflux pump subunit AcrA (membrane-fusion protein)